MAPFCLSGSIMPIALVESLDHEGRGVAHVEGKTVFIDGALPGEKVEYSVYRKKPTFDQAQVSRIIERSAQRVEPRCPHFGVCGGCSMQHLDSNAQAAAKQRVLEDVLWHIGRVRPEVIYPAIYGPAWGYRYRARIGVRLVPKKGGVLVGFHERRSSYIADMRSCEILPRPISDLLPALRTLIGGLSISDRLPQIEIAVGDDVTVLVFRNLLPLTAEDEARLMAFGDAQEVHIWLQPGGPDTAHPLHLGHHQIQDQQIWLLGLDRFQRLHAISGRHDLGRERKLPERDSHDAPHVLLIVRHEDLHPSFDRARDTCTPSGEWRNLDGGLRSFNRAYNRRRAEGTGFPLGQQILTARWAPGFEDRPAGRADCEVGLDLLAAATAAVLDTLVSQDSPKDLVRAGEARVDLGNRRLDQAYKSPGIGLPPQDRLRCPLGDQLAHGSIEGQELKYANPY